MELAKMILDYVLDNTIDDELIATLEVARKLAIGMDGWMAEKALKVLFGGETNAE